MPAIFEDAIFVPILNGINIYTPYGDTLAVLTLPVSPNFFRGFAFSADYSKIIVASNDGKLYYWTTDIDEFNFSFSFQGVYATGLGGSLTSTSAPVYSILQSQPGDFVVTNGYDYAAYIDTSGIVHGATTTISPGDWQVGSQCYAFADSGLGPGSTGLAVYSKDASVNGTVGPIGNPGLAGYAMIWNDGATSNNVISFVPEIIDTNKVYCFYNIASGPPAFLEMHLKEFDPSGSPTGFSIETGTDGPFPIGFFGDCAFGEASGNALLSSYMHPDRSYVLGPANGLPASCTDIGLWQTTRVPDGSSTFLFSSAMSAAFTPHCYKYSQELLPPTPPSANKGAIELVSPINTTIWIDENL